MADHTEPEDHDRGLAFDLDVMKVMNRRRALLLLGGAGLATIAAACGSSAGNSSASSSTTPSGGTGSSGPSGTTGSGSSSDGAIPQETGGPYPGDGSNGVNVLTEDGIVRSDIRSSFGSSTTTATGVDTTFKITVLDLKNNGAPMVGAAVYAWHCDQQGRYSMYSQGVTDENYLRGVQPTDDTGTATFQSIFPAAYSGRWPHLHFEIYPSVADAQQANGILRTSQMAIPEDIGNEVYATSGYEQSVQNMKQTSLERDNVFSDGWSLQTPTVSGSVDEGIVLALSAPI